MGQKGCCVDQSGLQWGEVVIEEGTRTCFWASTSTRSTTRTGSPFRPSSGTGSPTASCSPSATTAASRPIPTAQYEETISARIKGIDPISKEAKIMRRAYFSAATVTEMDKQGRVVLPAGAWRSAPGIDKDVVVAGLYDYLEIWDREAWQKQRNEVEGRVEDVAERLAKLD